MSEVEVPLPSLRQVADPSTPVATFEPVGDRLLIRKVEAADKTAGGLFVPEMAQEANRPMEGWVVAVGQGRMDQVTNKRVPMVVSLGDRVCYSKFAGAVVSVDGEDMLVLREDEVLGILRPAAE